MSVQINFNGQTYNNLDEMPPEVRQAYVQAMALLADQDGNGLPDFVDGLLKGQGAEALKPFSVLSSANPQIVFNGQTYNSVAEMPPEAWQAYRQAMAALDQNRNGLPDTFEPGGVPAGAPAASATTAPPAPHGSAPRQMFTPYTPAGVESDDPAARAQKARTRILVLVAVAALVVVLALSGAVAFLLGSQFGG